MKRRQTERRETRRDEFAADIKDLLARRVGVRCSNPNCRQPTSGPQEDPRKTINIGVAAHIAAAASRGPRYDHNLTSAERSSYDNGIWLCQNCAKLIDNDDERYHVDLLRAWKSLSEDAARLAIETPWKARREVPSDVELIAFYAQCFDRPAFQDHFRQEGSMEAFDKAIEDTVTAINTGSLRARDGTILQNARGKAHLRNPVWREQMDVIVDLLRAMRSRYAQAKKSRLISVDRRSDGTEFYCIYDQNVADWMDGTRSEIMRIFSGVADEAGMRAPRFPRTRRYW
jgi:hypothetical protein